MITKGDHINNRYEIIKNIGEGGMANVYLAYDTILDRNVAVKILRGDLANDDKFVRRFQREALSASSLNHPNIVEVYDVGEDNGQYFIVMEYIEGKHLKSILRKRGKLTIPEVTDIMIQISEGMAHAHDSYIIHRDIKPQNIMILDNGLVKITDFGIAMALNSTQLTQTNSVMGTVHYLPPEQANGKGATIRSDIYSMGILMYELLTGSLPFKGDNAVEIALKHLKEEVPSIRKEIPDLPQSIENVIIKATAKNPKNRYADAREMCEDLKTVMNPERSNEPKYIYPYPEKENDDNKVTKMLSKSKKEDTKEEGEEIIAKQITENDLKKDNKILLILGAVFTGLILVTTVIFLFIGKMTDSKDIKIPDVATKTIAEAEKMLKDAGFKVATETKEINSKTIAPGLVVKTSPGIGLTRAEGTIITIYESIGDNSIEMEDYTGKNYLIVQAKLEVYKINVIIEKEEVEDPTIYEEGEIIGQSPEVGSSLSEGDTVTLKIPNIVSKYPDFVNGGYSREELENFCAEYKIELKIEEVEDATKEEGTIIYQSRPADSVIPTSGGKLTVKVTVLPGVDDVIEGALD